MTVSPHFSKSFTIGAVIGCLMSLFGYGALIYLYQHDVCHSIMHSVPKALGETLIALSAIAGTIISGGIGIGLGGIFGMSIQTCQDCCCDEGCCYQKNASRERYEFYNDSDDDLEEQKIVISYDKLPGNTQTLVFSPTLPTSSQLMVNQEESGYHSFNHPTPPLSPRSPRNTTRSWPCLLM